MLNSVRAGEAQGLVLSKPDFDQLREIIYRHSGIFFPDGKQYLLESRAMRRVTQLGYRGFSEYVRAIKTTARDEVVHLVEAITVNETYFFRNTAQLDVLEKSLLPALVEARKKQGLNQIHIWSAACSTGEEPYTIAMMIRERLVPRFPQVRWRIIGTDVNTKVIERAKEGEYRDYAMRLVPQQYLTRYFTRSGDRFILNPETRQMVEFRVLNLFDSAAMRSMRLFDVIFCANVLIYFDQQSKTQVISSLYDSLNRGGALFLGFSESLNGLSLPFRSVSHDKAIAYMKD